MAASPRPRRVRPLDGLRGALPVLASGVLASRAFERTMCLSMVALASLCLWRGCRVHGRWPLLGLLAAGAVTTLTVQWFAPPVCCAQERANWTEAGLMCAGGLAIAAAHLLNLRYTRRCACCAPKNRRESP